MDPERFFVGKRRDSNPQGCGAEETRSVFQRGPLRPISAESSPPSRHLGTVPKCRLGTIFEDPPKAPVQKMANMSTVTVIVTFSLSTKDLLMGLILIKDFFY